MKGRTVILWHDERAKPGAQWTLTIRRGDSVENLRFKNKTQALTYRRGLKSKKRVASR